MNIELTRVKKVFGQLEKGYDFEHQGLKYTLIVKPGKNILMLNRSCIINPALMTMAIDQIREQGI